MAPGVVLASRFESRSAGTVGEMSAYENGNCLGWSYSGHIASVDSGPCGGGGDDDDDGGDCGDACAGIFDSTCTD